MVVTMLRGRGVLRLGNTVRQMRAGDVAMVQRGEPHWFTNQGREPSVTLVVYAPPLDAPDTTPVDVDSSRPAR